MKCLSKDFDELLSNPIRYNTFTPCHPLCLILLVVFVARDEELIGKPIINHQNARARRVQQDKKEKNNPRNNQGKQMEPDPTIKQRLSEGWLKNQTRHMSVAATVNSFLMSAQHPPQIEALALKSCKQLTATFFNRIFSKTSSRISMKKIRGFCKKSIYDLFHPNFFVFQVTIAE